MKRRIASPLLVVACLCLGMAACSDSETSEKHVLLKADKSQIAFFNRPFLLAEARSSSTPSPLIVLLQSDPWLAVTGSDSPAFALYDDGTVIFRTKSGFLSTKLDRSRKDALVEAFGGDEMSMLAGRYSATNITDQPDSSLLLYGRKVPAYITVYGSLDDEDVRSSLPEAVLTAFDRLRGFSSSGAQPWLPEKVEVMIWPYDYAPDQSIMWPKRWPGLKGPATRKQGNGYSIFLPSSDLPALRAFLGSRREKGAIEIDGQKWSASVRYPFPHEELWMASAEN